MNIAIWGTSFLGRGLAALIRKTNDNLVGFIDNNPAIVGTIISIENSSLEKRDYNVYSFYDLPNIEVDKIIISVRSKDSILAIKEQLKSIDKKMCVEVMLEDYDMKAIEQETLRYTADDKRVAFLRAFSKHVKEQQIIGNVAECGVNFGDFAYYINKYFEDRQLYLFDTYEGFDDRDLQIEFGLNNSEFLRGRFSKPEFYFKSQYNKVDIVINKMLNPSLCTIKKGYFPESATDFDDVFCFVNLDFDLYNPTLAGLEFFYDKISIGGMILLHDYYNWQLPGVKQAVDEFETKRGIRLAKTPIGDNCSLAIIKY